MGALPLKEVDLLVETLAIARRQIPQLRFMAIGVSVAGSTLPLRDVMGSRLGDWMIETGRVPFAKVSEYLAACDVLALPMRNNISNVARWPSKLNDYLASGRPIVATSVGEIEAFAGHGFGIFTRDTAQDLAAGIVQFANDANLSEHCGALARRLAEGQLNWHTIVSDLEALYTQVYDRA
jgi:glycosyltransferase involved in cell wall biosynthesis